MNITIAENNNNNNTKKKRERKKEIIINTHYTEVFISRGLTLFPFLLITITITWFDIAMSEKNEQYQLVIVDLNKIIEEFFYLMNI